MSVAQSGYQSESGSPSYRALLRAASSESILESDVRLRTRTRRDWMQATRVLLQNGADPDFKATLGSASPRDFAQIERVGAAEMEARNAIRQLLADR